MDKIYKIAFLLFSLFLTNLLGIHGISLAVVLLVFPIIYWKARNLTLFWTLIFTTLLLNIAYLGKDYISIAIYSIIFYIIRILWQEKSRLTNFLGSSLLLFGVYFINPDFSIYPLLIWLFYLPIFKLEINPNSLSKIVKPTLVVLNILGLFYCLYPEKWFSERKSAYLKYGVWADPTLQYQIDSLSTATAYSYSEFVNLIHADTISNIKNIDKYTELWIVTPTIPFEKGIIDKIENWVKQGGHLILVSDHTDLYGHARCCNQLSNSFGCETAYSGLFDKENHQQVFNTHLFNKALLKTGTSLNGRFLYPIVSSYLWEEKAYYNNENFFGPMSASGDDSFGNKLIIGQKAVGLGQFTYLGDSTFFSNFALYQPYTPSFIQSILCFSFFSRFLTIAVFLIAFTLFAFYSKNGLFIALLSVWGFTILVSPFNSPNLTWKKNCQIWSGNPDFVLETSCPYASISTAYSLAALSGRQPKWESKIDTKDNDVIWVDSNPPPNKMYRWIRINDSHHFNSILRLKKTKFDSLYSILNCKNYTPYLTNKECNYNYLNAHDSFSDKLMNTWWYNQGISTHRREKIDSWLNWLDKKPVRDEVEIKLNSFSQKQYKAIVKVDKTDTKFVLMLPKPNNENGFIYLGNGLSGFIVMLDGKKNILGMSEYSENWDVPKIWAIEYLE